MRFNQNPVQPDPNSIRRSRNAVSLDKYDVEGNTVEWPKMANRSGWMIYPVDDVTEFYCRNRKQTKPKKRVEQRGGYRRRGSGGGGAGTGGGGGAGRRGAQVVAQALQRFLHGDGAVPSVHLRFCLFFLFFVFFFGRVNASIRRRVGFLGCPTSLLLDPVYRVVFTFLGFLWCGLNQLFRGARRDVEIR